MTTRLLMCLVALTGAACDAGKQETETNPTGKPCDKVGASRCVGAAVEICRSTGWASEACDPGTCVESADGARCECEEGANRCFGSEGQYCLEGEWVRREDCAPLECVNYGPFTSCDCPEDHEYCAGSVIMACDWTLKDWVPVEDCGNAPCIDNGTWATCDYSPASCQDDFHATDVGLNTTGPIAFEDLHHEMIAIVCGQLAGCCADEELDIFASIFKDPNCHENPDLEPNDMWELIETSVSEGYTIYDPVAGRACVEHLKGLGCCDFVAYAFDGQVAAAGPDCFDMFTGTLPNGSPCGQNMEHRCQSFACSSEGGTRVCASRPSAGEPCQATCEDGWDCSLCEEGLMCQASEDGATCAANAEPVVSSFCSGGI